MSKTVLKHIIFILTLATILMSGHLNAQTTVLNENFNTSQGTSFTTSGPIGGPSSIWNVTRSVSGDFGAKIDGGLLTLTNDASSAGRQNGWVLASIMTSSLAPNYKSTLNQNVGIVSWSFNMRNLRSGNNAFTGNNYGVAYILAGTDNTTSNTGVGYAVRFGFGNGETLRLIRYVNGLSNQYTLLTSPNVGKNNVSIRIEYNPQTENWSIYTRQDPEGAFTDPSTGPALTLRETQNHSAEDWNLSGRTDLSKSGAFWYASTAANANAIFDNVKITVVVPEILSLTPSSTTAGFGPFTLTVNGKNFKDGDKIYWNGNLRTTTFISATQLSAQIPATDVANAGIAEVTVKRGTTFTTNSKPFTIQEPLTPILVLPNTTLANMQTTQGTPSGFQSYTISANNLTTDVIVTAPDNFEISKSNSGGWAGTLTLQKQSGNNNGGLLGTPVTIYARLTGTTAGVFSGNISHAATGATTKNVAISGRVLAIEPITPASTILFSNKTSTSFKANWTNGSGGNRLLIVKKASAVDALPSDGSTYFENATFGNGSDLGTGNFVVYKGSGNSVTVTGLEPSTNYHVSVIEFNGPAGAENYRSVHVTGNTTTLNNPVGLQLFAANTSYKINFDQTVDGVNEGRFEGSGINPNPTLGQLDSDAWAFRGFAGGDLLFEETSLDNSSYEKGTSNGNVTETGIYGFNVGSAVENYSLGIQPGGADFNPGDITLKIQNQTGVPMTSVNIGYKVYVYNDQEASSQIRFSSSLNGTDFTDQTIVDVTSPTTADLAPGWKAYYRVVTIPTGSIANNEYYYIKWTGSNVSGTGAQDEFAIDDIEVIANPTGGNYVSFDGVAEDFVLQGNANLSADLSVQNRLVFNGGKLAIINKTLTIAGSVTNLTPNGLKGGATSKLVVRGIQNPTLSFDQTTGANVFESFSLIGASANTVTALNNFSVNNLLSVDEQQILILGTNTVNGNLTSIQNNGIIRTQNVTATPFASGKTWGGTGILNMNATSTAQTLVAGTYNNLTLSSTAGTTAVANVTVNGKLDLPKPNASATQGSLSMAGFTLTMGPDGTNTGIGEVTGIIKRDYFTTNKLYTFGHPNTSITFPPAGTLPDSMSIKLTIGAAPSWRTGAVKRSVEIIQTGGSGTKAIIRQHYLDSEVPAGKEAKLVFWVNRVGLPVPIFEQGRSSNNTADNWVEITNANVAQYFVSTFGTIFITLDQTEIVGVVWNGSVNDSWTTAENWTPSAQPGILSNVIIPKITIPGHKNPTLNSTATINSLTIEVGGVVNSVANEQLFINGNNDAWQNYGAFNSGTSTVTFNNLNTTNDVNSENTADATISGKTSFYNLIIATGAGIRPSEGNEMSISGTLTNSGIMYTTLIPNTIEFKGNNQIVPATGGESFGGYHHLKISGTGVATIAATTLNVRGNLTLDQPVTFIGKTVNLAGISNQTIGGTAAITFNNLIVNKETGAVLLAQDINVDGTLTLTKGNVVLGANNLTLGSNPVAGTFGTNAMIVADGAGFVRRPYGGTGSYLFPIGELTGAPNYSPITVNVTAGTGTFSNAFVAVNTKDEKHESNFSTQNFIRHYWNVKQSGITDAVATITANYETLDINGSESEIAAAQLTGTFNAETNPWVKFGALSNNTLTATGAILTDGQTSVFTGLKGGDFSVEVFGYGDFCLGSTDQSMNAVLSGGDAPYKYEWSNSLPNTNVVTIPTTTVGTINYTLTVRDANGFVATDNTIPVTIVPLSVGGTIDNHAQQICAGSAPADLVLNGSVGEVLYWQKSTVADFSTYENLSKFTTTLTQADIGPIAQTTYFRVFLKNSTCAEAISSVATITIKSTTWNGIGWSDGNPTPSTSVIFAADYTMTGSLEVCSVTVTNNAKVIVPATFDLTANGRITVDSGASLTFESNTNLIQGPDVANSGIVTVKRASADLFRLDYTMWGSPLTGTQTLKQFSPLTFTNRFYTYNSSTDEFNVIDPNANGFVAGKGYLIRMPDNHISFNGTNLPLPWVGTFIGTPNNGRIEVPLTQGFNMIANPYASMINAVQFLTDNSAEIEGPIYFWRRRNAAPSPEYLATAYYATYTIAGGAAVSTSINQGQTFTSEAPNGFIQVGQGFIVQKKAGGSLGTALFTNSMRTKSNNDNQFFKSANTDERSRIWLNVTNAAGEFGQTLIAYMAQAENGVDRSDGIYLNDGSTALTSWLDNSEYIIQGRAPFTVADVVPLNFKTLTAGSYTIAIDHVDGLFTGNQAVFLKDNLTGITHNLKTSAYTFATVAGSFNARFELRYFDVLSVENPTFNSNSIVLYKEQNDIVIHSGKAVMDHVEVYDLSGRLLISTKKINSNEVSINVGQTNQVLIVKITSTDGFTVNKKTIN